MIAIALGALFLALSTIPAGLAVAEKPPTATYLALGDSLAVGVGAAPLEDQFGYVGRFNRYFQESREGPHGLSNLAISGETSSSFVNGGQLAAAVSSIADANTDVQVVTPDIGGNDLLGLLRPGAPCAADPAGQECQYAVAGVLTTFAGNYPAILGSLAPALAGDPGPEAVVVVAYYNPFDGTGSPYETPIDVALLGADLRVDCVALGDPRNTGLNDLITCVGSSFGARVVDAYPVFDGKATGLTHIADGDIHPNNDGYALIADAVAVAVE